MVCGILISKILNVFVGPVKLIVFFNTININIDVIVAFVVIKMISNIIHVDISTNIIIIIILIINIIIIVIIFLLSLL